MVFIPEIPPLRFSRPLGTGSLPASISLFGIQTVKQFREFVGGGAIDDPAIAGIGNLAEEQFAAAVAVGIEGVHQFEARINVEMIFVGNADEELVQVVVD